MTHRSRRIASKIRREKRQRLCVKLRSLALLCRFLGKPPRWVLASQTHSLVEAPSAQAKWFFKCVRSGRAAEVKSLVKAEPGLVFRRDRVA